MDRPIQSVVIVGGGAAGWLTAGVIAARHQGRMAQGFSVTLVESPSVPIIGVGEGTWPSLRSTLQKIGVSETELFRQCDAAFKQGARRIGRVCARPSAVPSPLTPTRRSPSPSTSGWTTNCTRRTSRRSAQADGLPAGPFELPVAPGS